jgi:hypothetical protein
MIPDFRHRSCDRRRKEEFKGGGSSPRSLSPITDIWRSVSPVECLRLSVSRRCVGLHGQLQTVPAPQRSRPPRDSARIGGLSGEASGPGPRCTCRHTSAKPGRLAFAVGSANRPSSAGSAPRACARDRWPHATGLASYPSSCVFVCRRVAAVFAAPPAFGSCCRTGVAADSCGGFSPAGSLRDDLVPLRVSGCDAGTLWRLCHSSCPTPPGPCPHTGSQ